MLAHQLPGRITFLSDLLELGIFCGHATVILATDTDCGERILGLFQLFNSPIRSSLLTLHLLFDIHCALGELSHLFVALCHLCYECIRISIII